ncbi:MAG TPA: protein kinase [Planktothrix sp.]|jgi:serine/threonine-protein kinase
MKLCLRCNQYFEDGIELCPIDTSQLEAVGDHPLIGALINDRYVVDSVIGKGSTGIVYKATRLLMGTEVAVKVLHSYLGAETGALDRFLRETRAASRLRHPHIINIWEFGATDDGQPYFVMDYLEGMTLADLIKQKGALHPMKMMPIIRQVCEALAEAHKQSIIHRDIKPENIVLQETDYAQGQDFVKVLDFGIADQPAGQGGQKRAKMAAGSPAYMSPEQCQGFELDHRSDIYSLGIVVYEMLTGERPFAADDVMALFYQHVSKPPEPMGKVRSDLAPSFTPQLEAAVAKALAKKPQNRQQSIKEFQRELEDACKVGESAQSKKVDSIKVDLFSVPLGEMLTGETMTNTGSKFLPGPEDWLDQSEPARRSGADNVPLAPSAKVLPSPPDNNKPTSKVLPPPPDNKAKESTPEDESKQEYQAAVNRLLKSAKKASQAAMQDSAPAASDNPEVSNWAKDVLNRADATKSGTDLTAVPSLAEPPKPAASAPSKPAEPTEPVKPAAAAKSADVGADSSKQPPPEAPEVTTWAQRVLSRTSETNMPQIPREPAPNTPPSSGDGAKKPAPSALPDDDWNERVNTVDLSIARPADSLRSSTELKLPFESLEPAAPQQEETAKSDEAAQPAGAPVKPGEDVKPAAKPATAAGTGAIAPAKPAMPGQPKPAGTPAAKPGLPPQGAEPTTSKTGMAPGLRPAAPGIPSQLKPGSVAGAKPSAPGQTAGSPARPGLAPGTKPAGASTSASGIPPAKPATPATSATGMRPTQGAPFTLGTALPAAAKPAAPSTSASGMAPGVKSDTAAAKPLTPTPSPSQSGMSANRPAASTPSSSHSGVPSASSPATWQTGMPAAPSASQSKLPAQEPAPESPAFDISKLDAIKAPSFDLSELDAIKAPPSPSSSHTGMAPAEPRPGLGGAFLKKSGAPNTSKTGMQPAEPVQKPAAFDASHLDAIKAPSLNASDLDSIKAPAAFNPSDLDAIKSPAKADAKEAPGAFDPKQLNSIKAPSSRPFVAPPTGKEGKPEAHAKPIRPPEKKNSIAQAAERLMGSFFGGDKGKEKEKKSERPAPQPGQAAAPSIPAAPAAPGIAPGMAASAPTEDSPFGGLSQGSSPFSGGPQPPSFDVMKKAEPFAPQATEKAEPENHKPAFPKKEVELPVASAIDKMLEVAAADLPKSVAEPELPKMDFSKPSPLKPDFTKSSSVAPTAGGHGDFKRFNEPINKATDSHNPFANAVESMLDAAILPQRPLDKEPPATFAKVQPPAAEKFAKSSDLLNAFAQEAPVEPPPAQSAFDPQRFAAAANSAGEALAKGEDEAARAAAEARAEVLARAAQLKSGNSPVFDPKRFEEPVNKGGLAASRFDAEVNKALEPVGHDAQKYEQAISKAPGELKLPEEAAPKSSFDPGRFDQPVNKGMLEASAIDSAIDRALEPAKDATRSTFDARRFDEPVNKGSLAEPTRFDSAIEKALAQSPKVEPAPAKDAKRLDEPVSKGPLETPAPTPRSSNINPFADKPDTASQEKPTFDPKRFEQPVNAGTEQYNPFAQAVDTLLDSAIIKPDAAKAGQTPETPAPTPQPSLPPIPAKREIAPSSPYTIGQAETGLISPAMLKAEQAAHRARTSGTATGAAAEATASGGEGGDDKISEAVTRLIEAAKRAPEPTVATPGKPEALNRKIEAVKRKIEALKSGAAPTGTPGAPGSTEPPVRPLPADPNSLTEAVNKLLEAAQTQSGIYQNLSQQQQAAASAKDPSMQNLTVLSKSSDVGMPQVPRNAPPMPRNMPQEEGHAVQSESMTRAHELINNALKQQRSQTEAQDYYSGYKTSDKPITQDRTNRVDQRRKDRARLRQAKSGPGILKALWFILLLVGAGAAICYTFHIDPRDPMAVFHHQPVTFEDFVKAGQFDDALQMLDKKGKNPKITSAEQDKLYDQYVYLAKKQAAAKKYADAITTLNKLPHRAARAKNVDRWIRRYQRAAQTESGSSTTTAAGN